jgi:hypoxanthine phosphoribosyltransferase
MPDPRNYVAPGWDEVYAMLLDLALKIRKSGFKADLIVGVSRGGWAPARILSDLLENARTANIRIEFYTGLAKTASKPIVTQPISLDTIGGKHALVVDDVSDTGESLKLALEHLLKMGASTVKTVTIYYKPHSIFKPDYFAESTSDWIIFPWERLEATRLLIDEAKSSGRDMGSVREILRKCNFSEATIDRLFQLANGES